MNILYDTPARSISRPLARSLQRFVMAGISCFLALTAIVLVIRLQSLFRQGAITATTGTEGPMIYGVWKAAHGYPLYENIHHALFSNTLYNYLFYFSYAAVSRLVNGGEAERLLVIRLFTLLLATAGVFVGFRIYRLVESASGQRSPRLYILWAVVLFWYSTSPVGWFELSVRPDIGAVLCAECGLFCFLCFLLEDKISLLLVSSAFFLSAWAFKQSIILTFIGALFALVVLRRKIRPLLALLLPFTLSAGLSLLLGGSDYRFNILTIPSLGTMRLDTVLPLFLKTVAQNPGLYILPASGMFVLLLARMPITAIRKFDIRNSAHQALLLGIMSLIALLGGIALCTRVGSDRNYFFEAGMIGSLALLPCLRLLYTEQREIAFSLAALATVAQCVLCAVQISALLLSRGAPGLRSSFLGKTEFGRLRLLTDQEEQDRRSALAALAAANKPALVIDDLLSQPWYTTNNTYPAFVIDPNVFDDLERKRLLPDGGISSAIKGLRFQTLILKDPKWFATAEKRGYVRQVDLGREGSLYTLRADGDR